MRARDPWKALALLPLALVLLGPAAPAAAQEAAGGADAPSAEAPAEAEAARGGGEAPPAPEAFEAPRTALVEALPRPLRTIHVLEIALWQWIALALLLLLAGAVGWLGDLVLVHVAGPIVARSPSALDDRLLTMTVGPVRLLLAVAVFAGGTVPLALADPAQTFFHGVALLLAVVGFTWLLFRGTDLLGELAGEGLQARGQEAAVHLIPLGRKVLKVVVASVAFLAALDSFGFDVTALVAGLGVGGIAVALAAQKTIENFFGGLSVLADRPVQPGDFCRYGDKLGIVEEVGLRSTRVRSLERTRVTVPNADFSTLQIENFAARDSILLSTRLGLRYETSPDQLRWVLQKIREMLYSHPMMSPEPARIRFAGFGAYSLDLDIWAYSTTADWNEFLAVREDVFLRIMDIVAESGTGFAFPSQTTYLAKDGGLDAEGRERVEAQVADWRESRQLMLPTFPPERITELDDTLDWPPEGSAARESSGKDS